MRRRVGLFAATAIGLLEIAVACGPTAQPTATTQAQPTATTGPAATATTGVAQATATRPASQSTTTTQATATVADTKLRPLAVVAPPAPNPKAQKGGTYRVVANQDPPDFGIWDSSVGTTIRPAIPATDALLDTNEYEPNKVTQILPSLAYDWWTDAKGTTWTFKLKEGVKFTDGVEFTCADAKHMLDTIRLGRDGKGVEIRRSPRGSLVRRVTETRCPDKHTFEIVTDGPLPSLPTTLAHASFNIYPKHVYEGHPEIWLTTIGTNLGPFMFKEYKQTEVVKLQRNPNYWNQPYPYLDEVQVVNLGSSTAMQGAFRVGRAEEISGSNFPRGMRDPMEKEGKVVVQGKVANDFMAFFQANWQRKPWSDPRFSLAMRCAIDTAKVVATALDGEGFEGPLFPLATTPGGSEWAVTEEEWKAVHPCHGPSGDAANMEKRRQIARDLLAQLGFSASSPAKPSSYRQKDNAVWDVVLTDFKAVGIEPNMRIVNTDLQYSIQVSGDADIFQQGAIDSRRDPDHWLYAHYYSTSDRNYGKYANPEVDVLIDKQSKTLDKTERYKTLRQLEKILLRDNAKIVGDFQMYMRPIAAWLMDSYIGPPTNSQSSGARLARAWIDQAKMKQILGQ